MKTARVYLLTDQKRMDTNSKDVIGWNYVHNPLDVFVPFEYLTKRKLTAWLVKTGVISYRIRNRVKITASWKKEIFSCEIKVKANGRPILAIGHLKDDPDRKIFNSFKIEDEFYFPPRQTGMKKLQSMREEEIQESRKELAIRQTRNKLLVLFREKISYKTNKELREILGISITKINRLREKGVPTIAELFTILELHGYNLTIQEPNNVNTTTGGEDDA